MSNIKLNRLKAAVSATVVGLTAANISVANEESFVLEEVLVTAQKRTESLQDVTIPVTAFSANQLIDANFKDLSDLGNMVPGLSIGGSGSLETQVALRGLAPANAGIGQDDPIALYIDDVYIGSASNNFRGSMLGVEQVQVLRGPQGTLYGRNAVGGAIVVTTRKPSEETEIEIRASLAEYDTRELSAIVSGQLTDNVYGLISAKFDERNEGFQKNLADNRWTGGLKDEDSFRGVLRFLPSDDLEINLIADYSEFKGSGNGPARNVLDYVNTPGTSTVDTDPSDANWDEFYAWPSGDEGQNDLTSERMTEAYAYLDGKGLSDSLMYTGLGANVERGGFAGTVNYAMSDTISLVSVSSYRFTEYDSTIDSYSRQHPAVSNMKYEDSTQIAQEIRLTSDGDGPFRWIAGFSYFDHEIENVNIFRRVYCEDAVTGDLAGSYSGQANCVDGNAAYDSLQYNTARVRNPSIHTTSLALFGQGTYDITESLSATVGLRWTDEEKDWDIYFKNFTVAAADAVEADASESWSQVSPKFGLEYSFDGNVMVYATATEGFKSGGFNSNATSEGGESVNPETSLQYEVGLKSELFDNRVRLNVAAFFNDYTDLQLRVVCDEQTDSTCSGSTALRNASAAEIKGVEAEFVAQVTPSFMFSGFVSYLDATFTDYKPNPNEDFTGNTLPRAPELQYSLTGNYAMSLDNGNELNLIATYHYSASEFFRANNTALDENNSNNDLTARLVYTDPEAGWELALFGTNLTNEHYRNNGFAIGTQTVAAFYNPPRVIGAELIWRL